MNISRWHVLNEQQLLINAVTGKVGTATTDDPYAFLHVVSGQAFTHRERPISGTGSLTSLWYRESGGYYGCIRESA